MTSEAKKTIAVFEAVFEDGRAFTYAEIKTIIGKINATEAGATTLIQDSKFFTSEHKQSWCELYVDLGYVEGVVTFEQIGGDAVRVTCSEWEA